MQVTIGTDRAHSDSCAPSAREIVVAGTSAALTSTLYVLLAAWHGALGVARNDDWVYYRSAFRLAQDGSFSADPWADVMLVGHVVLAQPIVAVFGSSPAALQVMVSVLGAVGLTATYLMVRSFLPTGHAAFAIGCLAQGPV